MQSRFQVQLSSKWQTCIAAKEMVRKHYSGIISDEIEKRIYRVTKNDSIAEQVVTLLSSRLKPMRRSFLRFTVSSLLIAEGPIQLIGLTGHGDYLASKQLMGNMSNGAAIFEVGIALFLVRYVAWQRDHHLAIVGNWLIRAIDAGVRFKANPTDYELRDRYARSIYEAAKRYRTAFRRCNSSFFFAAHVRTTAKRCRDDIFSLVPEVVEADTTQIDALNDDLTRLLIRSQLGYWYQTTDIRRPHAPQKMTRRVRIAILGALTDRAIQTALISALIAFTAALLAFYSSYLKR